MPCEGPFLESQALGAFWFKLRSPRFLSPFWSRRLCHLGRRQEQKVELAENVALLHGWPLQRRGVAA